MSEFQRALQRFQDGLPTSVAELPPDWRARLEEALRGLQNALESPHSKRAYRDDWHRWCEWLASQGVHPLLARAVHVQRYLGELYEQKKAKPTRARCITVIRSVYSVIVVSGLMLVNPAREVKNIKVSPEPKTPWLAEDEVKKLLAHPGADVSWSDLRDWIICITLLGTGLRRAEVARLRRDQFIAAPGGLALKVRAKRGKEGFVPVPTWLSSEISLWCQNEGIERGPLFPRSKGGDVPISPSRLRTAVKNAAARADLPKERCTPHALRRSFVTLARQRGASLEGLQHALMHGSITTTELYDHGTTIPSKAPGELLADLIVSPTFHR